MNHTQSVATQTLRLRLTIEEVALLYSLVDRPEEAKALLLSQIGADLTADEVRGRLKAAGRGLVLRDLLFVDQAANVTLSNSLRLCADILTNADYSIVFERHTADSRAVQTIHAKNGQVYRHIVDAHEGIHEITEMGSADGIARLGIEFFGIEASSEVTSAVESSLAPVALIAQFGTETGLSELERSGISRPQVDLLAENIASLVYRGDVLKVTYDTGTATAGIGFLILGGPSRRWMLTPRTVGEQVHTDIRTLDAATFEASILALID